MNPWEDAVTRLEAMQRIEAMERIGRELGVRDPELEQINADIVEWGQRKSVFGFPNLEALIKGGEEC